MNPGNGGNQAMDTMPEQMENIGKRLKTQNTLIACLLAGVVIFGVVVALFFVRQGENIARLRQNVEKIAGDVDDIADSVEEIEDMVSDIRDEIYCTGTDPDEVYDPYVIPSDQWMTVDKPVIYLYPDKNETEVYVRLELSDSEMIACWPEAEDGCTGRTEDGMTEASWTLVANEDGTVFDADGNEYSYIFWEATDYGEHEFTQGFCVPGEDTAEFLRNTLSEIGLTPKEYNEFIVYWLPKMQNNAYNLITFEGLKENDGYNTSCRLEVTDSDGNPADSMLRLMMVWKEVDRETEIAPQTFTPFERSGFTVVEWGGTEVK